MDERIPETLREVFVSVIEEVRIGRRDQREISQALAHGFMMTLEKEGARILPQGGSNAGYNNRRINRHGPRQRKIK